MKEIRECLSLLILNPAHNSEKFFIRCDKLITFLLAIPFFLLYDIAFYLSYCIDGKKVKLEKELWETWEK